MASRDEGENSWSEYSKLVLKELETLALGIQTLNEEIQQMHRKITTIEAQDATRKDIADWKQRIDDVCSPKQLGALVQEVESLKIFKARAITVFAVIQFLMALTLFAMKFVK